MPLCYHVPSRHLQILLPFPTPPSGPPRQPKRIELPFGQARVELGEGERTGNDISSFDSIIGHLPELFSWRRTDYGLPSHLVHVRDAIVTRLAQIGAVDPPTSSNDPVIISWLLGCRNSPDIVEALCAAVGGVAGVGMWSQLSVDVNAKSMSLIIDKPTRALAEAVVGAGLGTSAPLLNGKPGELYATTWEELVARGVVLPDTPAMHEALRAAGVPWPLEGREGEGVVEVIENDVFGMGLFVFLNNLGLSILGAAVLRESAPSHMMWPYGAGAAQRRHPLVFQGVWWALVRQRFFVRTGGDDDDPDGYWVVCFVLVCLAGLAGRAVVLRNGPFYKGGGLRIGANVAPYDQAETASAGGKWLSQKFMARFAAHYHGENEELAVQAVVEAAKTQKIGAGEFQSGGRRERWRRRAGGPERRPESRQAAYGRAGVSVRAAAARAVFNTFSPLSPCPLSHLPRLLANRHGRRRAGGLGRAHDHGGAR